MDWPTALVSSVGIICGLIGFIVWIYLLLKD